MQGEKGCDAFLSGCPSSHYYVCRRGSVCVCVCGKGKNSFWEMEHNYTLLITFILMRDRCRHPARCAGLQSLWFILVRFPWCSFPFQTESLEVSLVGMGCTLPGQESFARTKASFCLVYHISAAFSCCRGRQRLLRVHTSTAIKGLSETSHHLLHLWDLLLDELQQQQIKKSDSLCAELWNNS